MSLIYRLFTYIHILYTRLFILFWRFMKIVFIWVLCRHITKDEINNFSIYGKLFNDFKVLFGCSSSRPTKNYWRFSRKWLCPLIKQPKFNKSLQHPYYSNILHRSEEFYINHTYFAIHERKLKLKHGSVNVI